MTTCHEVGRGGRGPTLRDYPGELPNVAVEVVHPHDYIDGLQRVPSDSLKKDKGA